MAKYSGTADNGEFDRAFQYARLELHQSPSKEKLYIQFTDFVWLPTGFGKSLCYEVLPFVMDHKLSRIDCDTHRSQLYSTCCLRVSVVILTSFPFIEFGLDVVALHPR